MNVIQNENLPPPPGLINSLRAGFDAIANHIPVIFLPVLLDLFLWLGPRLSLERLGIAIANQFPTIFPADVISPEEAVVMAAQMKEMLIQFNLFSALRTFPVGISSLMAGRMPLQNPFGISETLHVVTDLNALLWLLGLMILGWIGGGLYFSWVAGVTPIEAEGRPIIRNVGQTLLLSGIWTVLLFLVSVPILTILSVFLLVSPALSQLVVFLLVFALMWMALPVFFSPHGIFTRREAAWQSIRSSIRMVRFTLPTSSLFVTSVFVLSYGMNLLWSIPDETSWLSLVGILGHAFITTALLAASFIYYRDVTAWLQLVLEKINSQQTSSAKI